MKLERPIVVLDLETTGTDIDKDRIVQLCMIKISGDERIDKTVLMNPEMEISPGATEVHGITNEMVKDAPAFAAFSKGIMKFIDGCDFLTFNGNAFDIPILYNEFSRAGIEWDWRSHIMLDSFVIFRRMQPRDLGAAVRLYCKTEHTGAHDAFADAEATLKVFYKQLGAHKDELPGTIEELGLFCNDDRKRADISGKFVIDDNMDYIFNFGQHRGKKAILEKGYLKWMLTKDFSEDTKRVINQILEQ